MAVTNKAGWESVVYWLWEGTLETVSATPTGTGSIWDSTEAASLTQGEIAIDRGNTFGFRSRTTDVIRQGHQLPGGQLGAYPLSFNANGTMMEVSRLFYTHFQDITEASPIGSVTGHNLFTPIDAGVSTNWRGVTLTQDWGGTEQHYHGCVMDQMVLNWDINKPMTITPTFKALTATIEGEGTYETGTKPVSGYYYQSPNFTITLQGTAISPQGFTITSNNHFGDTIGPNVRGRGGFVAGNFTAQLDLRIWRSDDLQTWMDWFAAKTVGTFYVAITAPRTFGTYEDYGSLFRTQIWFYGRLLNIPDISQANSAEAIDTLRFEMVRTEGTRKGYAIMVDTSVGGSVFH